MARRKENKTGKHLMTLLMVFLMIGGVGVIIVSNMGSVNRYGDYSFKQEGNQFVTKVNGEKVGFYFLPDALNSINVSTDASDKLKNSMSISLTYDLDDENAGVIELVMMDYENLPFDSFEKYFSRGTRTENTSINVIDCNDATEENPVVYFKTTNETIVYVEDGCIIAEASTELNIVALRDKMLFELLEI